VKMMQRTDCLRIPQLQRRSREWLGIKAGLFSMILKPPLSVYWYYGNELQSRIVEANGRLEEIFWFWVRWKTSNFWMQIEDRRKNSREGSFLVENRVAAVQRFHGQSTHKKGSDVRFLPML